MRTHWPWPVSIPIILIVCLFFSNVSFSAEETAAEEKPVKEKLVHSAPVLPTAFIVNVAAESADPQTLSTDPQTLSAEQTGQLMEPRHMMGQWMYPQVIAAEQRWIQQYEAAKTPDQIQQYQQSRKQFFLDAIGGLPERCPLNPRVTGVVEKEGYKVEKVLFESQPNFLVSANVFLPDETKFPKPWPGVLVACGHSLNGKGYVNYQRVSALLALNGMAAMIFDPIDQGERPQLVDRETKKPLATSVNAHNLLGIGSILLGRNTARFEIWDGFRGIDYLQSRPDVDPERIGACGLSGGGTQTAYFMALDERIKVAASLCYLTSQFKMLKMNKPQDAEQNIFGQTGFGMDHADYCIMRAPMPTMIGSATKDFFPIKETWESYRYAKRMFELLGYGERMNLSETNNTHGYDTRLREATVRFMQRFLLGHNEAVTGPNVIEPIFEPERVLELTEDELRVTESGLTVLEPNSRTTYDLNNDYAAELTARRAAAGEAAASLAAAGETASETALQEKVRSLAQFRLSKDIQPLIASERNPISSADAADGIAFERIIFKVEDGLFLPAVWVGRETAEDKTSVTVCISNKGHAGSVELINKLVVEGKKSVLAVDLRGWGETQQTGHAYFNNKYLGTDGQDFYTAYDLGKTYVGWRAEDLLNMARWLRTEEQISTVEVYALGDASIPAVHAAFSEPDAFDAVTVEDTLVSWTNVVNNGGFSTTPLTSVVHGALTVYDLPDLRAALINAGKLTVVSIVDTLGNKVEQ